MDVLSSDELRILLEACEGPCISIFLPTHQVGTDADEDRIRLKNLLRQAEERLSLMGIRPLEIESMLEPGQALLRETLFWQQKSEGLAVFLSAGTSRHFRLPLAFGELMTIGNRFYVKPLLPLMSGSGRFYVLAISGDQVRLLRGTRDRVDQIEVKGIPANLAEALKYEDRERQLQYHTDAPIQGFRRRAAMFHGHGVGTDDEKDNLLQYFRQIDKGLHQVLRDERVPLVLAGVDYLFSIYREANTYPYLMDEGVSGNPEEMSAQELHERAWSILGPQFGKAQQEAIDQYHLLAGTGRASSNIREIVPASHYGRIDTLFVTVDRQQWGVFDRSTNEITLHAEPEIGDEDLLDLAAAQTILNGGTVYALEADDVPGGSELAAVFRY